MNTFQLTPLLNYVIFFTMENVYTWYKKSSGFVYFIKNYMGEAQAVL